MRVLSKCQLIHRSIHTKFRATIWNTFITGIKKYNLISPYDRIAVCVSGGKDSMLLAKLMQEFKKHSTMFFDLEFIVMDPGYDSNNRQKVLDNSVLLQIPIKIFETDIYDTVAQLKGSPCYICARMRRGYLYSYAKKLGCNKIALGHHFDDVIETTLMGILYSGQFQAMMPKLKSTNFENMELIRPLYCVHERDILSWKNYNNLEFIQCACRFTENCTINSISAKGSSKRKRVKELIKELLDENEYVDKNIFNSIHMINLDTVIGYKIKSKRHCFLEDY